MKQFRKAAVRILVLVMLLALPACCLASDPSTGQKNSQEVKKTASPFRQSEKRRPFLSRFLCRSFMPNTREPSF